MNQLPTYFLSHGGGPWPYLDGEMRQAHAVLEASLADIPRQLGVTPKAVVMVSGHWDEEIFTVMANPHPPMIYDYGGFPEHTYRISYPAPGSPELATRIQDLLKAEGFSAGQDVARGFDHGAFVPLTVMYPNANVPVVQLSLRSDFDPEAHIRLGRAIASLRSEGILILGSGLSYHNLRRFNDSGASASREFDQWLNETLRESDLQKRAERLIRWTEAPSARLAHPTADHFVPLMVAFGAAERESARTIYHEDRFFGGLTVSSFRFGD